MVEENGPCSPPTSSIMVEESFQIRALQMSNQHCFAFYLVKENNLFTYIYYTGYAEFIS